MQKEHFDYLDGWRGLAIAFLLIGHFFPVPGVNFGTLGVSLFFVLSGLLMGKLLFVQQVPLPQFYRRRISRIVPALLVFIALTTGAMFASGRPVNWYETTMAALLANNYFPPAPANAAMPFGHVWSLSVEEHAYIALSLIAIASRKSKLANPQVLLGLLALSCIGFGVYYWINYSGQALTYFRWMRSEVSAYGIVASAFIVLTLSRSKLCFSLPAVAFPGLLLVAIGSNWWSMSAPVKTFMGVAILAFLVNQLRDAPPLVQRALSIGLLTKLGIWSYSIYLWQQPFYLLVHREGLPAWAGLALSIFFGIASYRLVEMPARNYLNLHWDSRPSGPSPI